MCRKLGKRTEAEKDKLAQLFSSSKVPSGSRKRTFNPQSECVASERQRKKKASSSSRAVSRDVVVLSDYTPKIPKNQFRTELRQKLRIQSLQFKRNMSATQTKKVICQSFKHIKGISSFTYLDVLRW